MINEEQIKNALLAVKYPGFSRDMVSFGLVKEIKLNDGAVSVTMQLSSGSPEVVQQIKTESERVLKAVPGISLVHVEVQGTGRPRPALARRIPGSIKTSCRASSASWPSPAARAAWASPRFP